MQIHMPTPHTQHFKHININNTVLYKNWKKKQNKTKIQTNCTLKLFENPSYFSKHNLFNQLLDYVFFDFIFWITTNHIFLYIFYSSCNPVFANVRFFFLACPVILMGLGFFFYFFSIFSLMRCFSFVLFCIISVLNLNKVMEKKINKLFVNVFRSGSRIFQRWEGGDSVGQIQNK